MKDVSFSWNKMLFAMQKTDFHVLELFAEQVFRASMHRITSLELLRTLCCVSATKQMKRLQGQDAESFFLSERKLLNAILRQSSSQWKMFLSHEMKIICNAEDRFSCVRAFCRAVI